MQNIELTDAIAAVQVWFRHFGCDWKSAKIQAWLKAQGVTTHHALSGQQLRELESHLQQTWETMPTEKQNLLVNVSRLMSFFGLTWKSERITNWLSKNGLSSRDEMNWDHYAELGALLQIAQDKVTQAQQQQVVNGPVMPPPSSPELMPDEEEF